MSKTKLSKRFKVGKTYSRNKIDIFYNENHYEEDIVKKEYASGNGNIGQNAIHFSDFRFDVWFIFESWNLNGNNYKCVYNQ